MSYDPRRRSRADVNETEDEDENQGNQPLALVSRRYDLPTTRQSRARYELHPTQVQRTPIPARRSALPPVGGWQTQDAAASSRQRRRRGLFRAHPLLWTGLGMLLMLLLWVGLQDLGNWWSVHQDDVTYGPRARHSTTWW